MDFRVEWELETFYNQFVDYEGIILQKARNSRFDSGNSNHFQIVENLES